jgi:hypothetical protein
VVDDLADNYTGQPVVFLENDVDYPIGQRIDRWWAAFGANGTAYLPLVMLDSGHLISSGPVDFALVYSNLVEDELERPPAGEVEAYVRRVGNAMRIYCRAVNGTAKTLSAAANGARMHALVWENRKVGVTSRMLRAAPSLAIDAPVTPGGALTATLETPLLTGVDWSTMHALALVDYRPAGATGPYDTLQAALAGPPDLAATPDTLSASLHLGEAADVVGAVALRGPYVMAWTAATDVLWLAVTPGSGSLPADPVVSVVRERMATGVHTGHVTFSATSADGLSSTRTVEVTVDLRGPASRLRRRGVLRPIPD